MQRKLLISGDRASFTTLTFDEDSGSISITADYAAPHNVSWTEPVSSNHDVSFLLGLSEQDDQGLIYTFEINHERKTCEITSQQPTLGAPGHCKSSQAWMDND